MLRKKLYLCFFILYLLQYLKKGIPYIMYVSEITRQS